MSLEGQKMAAVAVIDAKIDLAPAE